MKYLKRLLFILAILLFIYFLFILLAPPIIDKSKNKVESPISYKVSQEALDLYSSLDFIGDLHCDALLWNRNLCKHNNYGHVDFPRMQQGNVAFQTFTIVTKSPKGQNVDSNSTDASDRITLLSIAQGQSPKTWFSLANRAIYQINKLHDFEKKYNEKFIVIKSKEDFNRLLQKRKSDKSYIGGLLGLEGGHCLEGDIKNLEKLYNAGLRMLGPTHFFDNDIGGSAHGLEKKGLTKFGYGLLKEMEKKNMIVDLAHASEQVIDDVLSYYNGPILNSHTGVDGIHSSSRNLSDKHLKAIAQKRGLIGIGFFPTAVGDNGVISIVETIKYAKDLIGVEFIALGSDFDGTVTTPFDITGLPILVEEMLRQGFTNDEIKAVMGENLKKYMLKNLP